VRALERAPDHLVDLEDQRHRFIAENRRPAEARNPAEVLLEALEHDLLVLQKRVDQKCREGLQKLDECSFDLILSDINMPEMDGVEFVRQLRARKNATEVDHGDKSLLKRSADSTPVVMVTTETDLSKVENALSAGANDYVRRPFTPDTLKKALEAFVKGS
jgi:two-component system chemotaxis response regulator CheY